MATIVGSGDYRYEQIDNWAKVPPGWSLREVGAVGVDAQDNVYVFNRGEHPMMVFDREGNFLRAWGKACFHARTACTWHPTARCSSPMTVIIRCGNARSTAKSC